MTAPGSSLGSCRTWVIYSFLGLAFFCADNPVASTRQPADATSAKPLMLFLEVRVAVNSAWSWAGFMGAGASIRIVANEELSAAIGWRPGATRGQTRAQRAAAAARKVRALGQWGGCPWPVQCGM